MRGFTLVELLLVVGILGLIAAGLLMTMNPIEQIQKARDVQRKNDLAQIQRALEAYYNDNISYPANTVDFKMSLTLWNWGSSWSPYMRTVPKDPISSQKYAYRQQLSGQGYELYARLERGTKDPQTCTGGVCGPANACGASLNCNFGVSSSNIGL